MVDRKWWRHSYATTADTGAKWGFMKKNVPHPQIPKGRLISLNLKVTCIDFITNSENCFWWPPLTNRLTAMGGHYIHITEKQRNIILTVNCADDLALSNPEQLPYCTAPNFQGLKHLWFSILSFFQTTIFVIHCWSNRHTHRARNFHG